MARHRIAAFAGLMVVLALAGCRGQKPAGAGGGAPSVVVVRPVSTPARDYWEYNGYLDTTEAVEVRARVKGLLTGRFFTEGTEVTGIIRWLNGDVLYPGDMLYQIDKREYLTAQSKAKADLVKADADIEKAKADILNWNAQIKLAEAEYARVDTAVSKNVMSKTDLDKAQAQVDVNKAQLAAAKATKEAQEAARDSAHAALHSTEIQLGYTDIRSQISGRISRTLITDGNLVGQTDPTLLTTIVRVDELYVYFDVPEPDLLAYQKAMIKSLLPDPTSQSIDVEVRLADEEGYPHKGKIDFRENRVETATGTVRLRGRLPNPPGPTGVRVLYPGLYARVRVPGGEPKPQLVIPEDALMTGQEGRFVYVVRPDDVVEKRIVTVGPTVWKEPQRVPGEIPPSWEMVNPKPGPSPENAPIPRSRKTAKSIVAITAGLKAEDRVIVEGLQRARPTEKATAEEWVLHPPDVPVQQ